MNKKIDRNEAKKMYNNIVNDANELCKLRLTNSRKKMFSIFLQFLRGLKQKMMKQKMMKQKMMKMMNNQTLQICLI